MKNDNKYDDDDDDDDDDGGFNGSKGSAHTAE